MYYKDGDRYEGCFKNNKREGFGTYYWKNQDRFEGIFVQDQIEGKGVYFYVSGGKYEGEFKDGRKEGHGTYFGKDGSYYSGEWLKGRFHGFGKMIYANKRGEYEGDWVNDQRHGNGKMTYQDGDVFVGSWKNDKRDGLGEMNFSSDKMIYKGEFKDDSLEGKGILYHKEGMTLYEGLWKNNQPWSDEQAALRQESMDFDQYEVQKSFKDHIVDDNQQIFISNKNYEIVKNQRSDSDDKIIVDSDEEVAYNESDLHEMESKTEGNTLSDVEEYPVEEEEYITERPENRHSDDNSAENHEDEPASSEYDEGSETSNTENINQSDSADPQSNNDELVKQIRESMELNQNLLNVKKVTLTEENSPNVMSTEKSGGNFNENFQFDSQENFEVKSHKDKNAKTVNRNKKKIDLKLAHSTIITDQYSNASSGEN